VSIQESKAESLLHFMEIKRHYNLSEKERRESGGLSDVEMIEFGIFCADYSEKTRDWRFVNLALKILDSKVVLLDKSTLEKKISYSLKGL
jgi:hypothetical protein